MLQRQRTYVVFVATLLTCAGFVLVASGQPQPDGGALDAGVAGGQAGEVASAIPSGTAAAPVPPASARQVPPPVASAAPADPPAVKFTDESAEVVTKPTCKTPYNAVESVWAWQFKVDKPNSLYASACFEGVGALNELERKELAYRVTRVYDYGPSLIDMDRLKELGSTYQTEAPQPIIVHPDFPDVYLKQIKGRWLWTKDSLDRVEKHYTRELAGVDKFIEGIPEPLTATIAGVQLWQYLALLLLFLVGLALRKLIYVVASARIKPLVAKMARGQDYGEALVDVFASPGATLVVAVILRIGYPLLGLPAGAGAIMQIAVRVLVTLSIIWAVYRGVDLFGAQLAERADKTESKLDDQLVPLVRKSLKVVVFLAGVVVVLQNLNFNVGAMLAGLSIGGIAFGLAAKDTLANFFGSISIFVDTPFQIGDWISAQGVDGTVEEVGFRSTRVRTFYNSVVCIPNASLANAKVDNYGQREFRRCFVTIGLTYDTTPEQMQAFCEGVRAVIRANEFTRKDSYEVHMSGFGDSSLDVMVYFFFKCSTWTDELREKHNVFLEIMRLARDVGASFAFPTQSLHLESVPHTGPRELPSPPDETALRKVVEGYGPNGDRSRPAGPQITTSRYTADAGLGGGDSDG